MKYDWTPSPHTADLAIEITGDSREGLFHAALDGYVGSLGIQKIPDTNVKVSEYGLDITVNDIEEALVDFLNECIYIVEVEELIPFQIKSVKFDGKNLDSVIQCRPIKKEERADSGHIKAATYAALEVTETDGIYRTRIIFDT